ncbi:hypothetical protein GEV27_07590 [Aeromicrobium sp. S22]|uniref:hypothetical protein n=1 Tax=Aeromicrobium sp. S22 TaxID=2662029 RepID=UPI00129DD69E|nr:hypothetical protein [Aeromicrobium sp. S22]MRK01384.1 hypothetical protein [Aeromicrobium sp. S22]
MTDSPSGEVLLFVEGDRLLVEGARSDIDALLTQLSLPAERSRRGVATGVAEVGAAAATAGAVMSTTRELYQLTPAAKALVAQFGEATNAAGDMAGVVRRDGSSIAGHLSFDHVSMGAEQAVALQTAAMAIALRSAIADVKKAVEEVDDKVEDLQRHVRAREIGEVIGLFRDLERVVTRTQQVGRILDADWDSVDSARRDLSTALERLRAYVTSTVRATAPSDDLPDRVKAVEKLSSTESVAGSLQLITVAEHALHLWHYLYVERVRHTEPEHLAVAVESARDMLDQQHQLDEELVRLIVERAAALGDVRPLEIHRRGSISKMDRALRSAREVAGTFADRTRSELPDLDREAIRPGIAEARHEVRARAVEARAIGADVSRDVAKIVKDRTEARVEKIRRKS